MKTSILAIMLAVVGLFCAHATSQQRAAAVRVPNAAAGGEVHHHYYGGAAATGYGWGASATDAGYSGGLASGIGQAREDTSEAAENYANTAHMMQENHNYAVNSYYANKDEHDAYVAAHREKPMTAEERAKVQNAADPGRLSSAQFDRSTHVITWPALLRDPNFADTRQKLDHLFDERTPANSGAASDNYLAIKQASDDMMKELDTRLRKDNLPAHTFIICEHFINSVAYEASFTAN